MATATARKHLRVVPASPRRRSLTVSATSRAISKPTPRAQEYLHALLPSGWELFFNARRAGRYWGLSIACPVCDDRIPDECNYGLRKWRWLAVHMQTMHGKEVKS